MTAGIARASDALALQQLWMDCFGDSKAYTDVYFRHGFAPQDVFVLRQAEKICAMCISFPVDFICEDGAEQAGAYLYAVCVDKRMRNRGLCSELMVFAHDTLRTRGMTFACLRAADDGLCRMYARMGYEALLTNCVQRVENGHAAGTAKRVDAARYFNLRELLLRGSYLSYPVQVLAHQQRLGTLLELQTANGMACAAAERDGDTLIFKEFLGDTGCLDAALSYFDATSALVRTPGEQPFAMIKTLTDLPAPSGYLAFAFD